MTENKPRGFAAMTPERRQTLAGRGGRAAHAKGTAHHWTREEARIAGVKGGSSVRRSRLGNETSGLSDMRKIDEVLEASRQIVDTHGGQEIRRRAKRDDEKGGA
jgi:hypothetical protein